MILKIKITQSKYVVFVYFISKHNDQFYGINSVTYSIEITHLTSDLIWR